MKGNGKNKTLLLGWDGADWKIINPLVDQGKMPNFKRLIENGTVANLRTLDPMYSPMLWTSIGTGKRPYKHGVLGFMEPTPDGESVRPVLSVSRKCKAIWNIFTQLEKKTHVVGWWPSHPADHINGVMVSNFYQNSVGGINEDWPMASGTVHPEEESEHFAQFRVHPDEITGNHIVNFVPDFEKVNQQKDKRLVSIANITAHASSLNAAFTNILRTKEWDFAALYLDAIDHYCHGYMKFHPPKRPHIRHDDFTLYKGVVEAGYRFHDMILGRIMNLIDDDTTLILISDHGFQPDHLRPRTIPFEPAGPAYEHNPYGVFAAMGPGIKKDHITYGASVLDVTPTILAINNVPLGEDMDGKPIMGIFEEEREINYIPSWENMEGFSGMLNASDVDLENNGEEALKQLEDLGYIERQDKDKEKRLIQTKNECQFNLARAYIDGGKIKEATEVLEKLHDNYPLEVRYIFRLAICYQLVGKIEEAKQLISRIKDTEHFEKPVIQLMYGNILLSEKRATEAIKVFKALESKLKRPQAQINLQLARAYSLLRRFDNAEKLLLRELDHNRDNDRAYYELGMVKYNQKYYEDAVDYFLKALGLNFNIPLYHYSLGEALYLKGEYEQSANAFEKALAIYPGNNEARNRLIQIYKNWWPNPDRLQEIEASFESHIVGTIYIVSGLPRSGTSMMMQMLNAGGLELYTDMKRQKDENNPKGYYEHELVKSLPTKKNWLKDAVNKTIKVVTPLLHHLPSTYHYKIIYMERDMEEILASQITMLGRMDKLKRGEDVYPTRLAESFKKQKDIDLNWASKAKHVELMKISYNDILESPFSAALKINDFMNYELIPELMAHVVAPELYRERNVK